MNDLEQRLQEAEQRLYEICWKYCEDCSKCSEYNLCEWYGHNNHLDTKNNQ